MGAKHPYSPSWENTRRNSSKEKEHGKPLRKKKSYPQAFTCIMHPELTCAGYVLYRLFRSSVKKTSPSNRRKISLPCLQTPEGRCTIRRRDSILMLEQCYFHVMEKLVVWLV